jgi:hypothetical protein
MARNDAAQIIGIPGTRMTSASTAHHGDEEAASILCPACGYDLRGMAGDRCSECGLAIDRAALRESGVAWAHRKRIGRVRAFTKTVWGATVNGRRLAAETWRPQEVRDGKRFRWVCAGLLVVTLLGVWGWVVWQAGLAAMPYPVVDYSAVWGGTSSGLPRWLGDVAVPWSEAMTRVWFVPACLLMLVVYGTGVQQSVIRVGKLPDGYRRSAGVVAH